MLNCKKRKRTPVNYRNKPGRSNNINAINSFISSGKSNKIIRKIWMVDCPSKGSHIIMTKPGSISTLSIPNHKEVARGTLKSLIIKAGINIEDFIKSL